MYSIISPNLRMHNIFLVPDTRVAQADTQVLGYYILPSFPSTTFTV